MSSSRRPDETASFFTTGRRANPLPERLDTPHMVLLHAKGSKIVRLNRTAVTFDSDEALRETFDKILPILRLAQRQGLRLLVDIRDGPLRTDSEFEERFQPYRRRMVRGFDRVAVLVSTAVGKLQVQRHAREDGAPMQAFIHENLAQAFLDQD